MPSTRRTSLVTGLLLAPVLLIGGGILFTSGPAPAVQTTAVGQVVSPAQVTGDPDALVATLQSRLERVPGDYAAWTGLGFAYLEQARRTADPSYYGQAEQALAKSLEVRAEDNTNAVAGQAALANARHEFALGRDLAQKAVTENPYNATARGILADSQLSLGEYDAAATNLDELVALRPSVPAYNRLAYSYELRGDIPNATLVLQQALDLSITPTDVSYAQFELGRLSLNTGDYPEALRLFNAAAESDDTNVAALAGRAAAAAASGDLEAAVEDYDVVVQRLPQPAYVVEYAELLESMGRTDEAADQFAVADVTRQLYDAAGVVPDVEIVLFEADYGDPARALDIAERNAETRTSVQVDDAMAWALHANGRDQEALAFAEAAQRIGTRNALWDYHRGMIQLELGMVEEARASLTLALETHPAFSRLHTPLAEAALQQIEGM